MPQKSLGHGAPADIGRADANDGTRCGAHHRSSCPLKEINARKPAGKKKTEVLTADYADLERKTPEGLTTDQKGFTQITEKESGFRNPCFIPSHLWLKILLLEISG
jgi:hypothetical protein